jgi:phosphoenolpyruvate---glycerone phosphotransferase subunit DhaL
MDAARLKDALTRWAAAMDKAAPELNALDSRLGDGDLGVTLQKCAHNVHAALPVAPDSVQGILRCASQACADASGSSFGTLLASGLLTAAKWLDGRSLDRAALPELLSHAVQRLCARGGASLGDKTMIDSLHAITQALSQAQPQDDLAALARNAAAQAIEEFRNKPNRIGRARMFAEKSIGMDDPGMVAVLRMAESL